MRSFLSVMHVRLNYRSFIMSLTRVYDALPFIFVLGPCFSVVPPRRHPHADIDQREYILVEQPLRREILHLLPVHEHISRDRHELVQSFEVAEQAGRIRGNERTRQPLILGCSGVGRSEASAFEGRDGCFQDAGEVVPKEVGETEFLTTPLDQIMEWVVMHVCIPELKVAPRILESALHHVALQHTHRLIFNIPRIVEVDCVGRQSKSYARKVRLRRELLLRSVLVHDYTVSPMG